MSIFRSQFDQARSYAESYAGEAGDPTWRPPAALVALAGAGVAVAAVAALTGDDDFFYFIDGDSSLAIG